MGCAPSSCWFKKTQRLHSTREQQGSDAMLNLEEHPSESTAGNKAECVLITHIRATNVTTQLRRIPIGFYVAVKTENGTKRTLNKPASVGKDVVEWVEEIVLPSDRSSRISLTVFASFEVGPTLGTGEALHEFETTGSELLDRNGQFELMRSAEQSDREGDSSSSRLEIEIERQTCRRNECTATLNPSETEEMHRLGELTDTGHRVLMRYRELQEQRDLDESIKFFEHARDLCPPNHPGRATVLFNLATAKLIYCRVNGASSDLDVPINLFRDVLRLRPRGHPDHPFTLLSLGVALEARFQRQNDDVDGTEGKSALSQVLDVAAADSYAYHAAVLALGSAAKHEMIQSMATEIPQASKSGVDDDDRMVQRLDDALQWIFHPDSWKHVLLDHLGVLFCIRLDYLGDLGDHDKAISTLEVVARFTSHGHPDKQLWLKDLGILLLTRFERSGHRVDLETSISLFEDALRLAADDHPDKPLRLNNLGRSLCTRYESFGDVTDLERSISLFKDAVELAPDGHPDKPSWLNNLGTSLSFRYGCYGNIVDLEESISLGEDVLRSTPDGHPEKPARINNLGCLSSTHYKRFGVVTDLERSISLFEDALKFTPDGHSDKPLLLDNLGRSLAARYERLGSVNDLERSISLRRDALQSTPDGHSEKPARLNNLGCSLSTRYDRLGDIPDLGQSISLFEKAIQFTPDGHPDKPLRLDNLGRSLMTRYQRFGDVVDLERSISLRKDARDLTPDAHPSKPLRLNNLGCSLSTRYDRLGDVSDLERSVSLFENAIQLTPDDHPDKPVWWDNLGQALSTRYERFGDITDLETSISLREDALQSTPDSHSEKPARLNNLGNSLSTRYEQFGDVVDLERSISLFTDAVELTPEGHLNEPLLLNNLGYSLSTRYKRFGDVNDLALSISLREHVVQVTPVGHPYKPVWLNNLGRSLCTRYERFGDTVDLNRSISLFEDAVEFAPDGHPDKFTWLNNLGSSLTTRYRCSRNIADLDNSISLFENAMQLTPDGHPNKVAQMNNLALSFLERFQHSGDLSELLKAVTYSSQATRSLTGSSVQRFEASKVWIHCVRLLGHDSLLDAYVVAIDLLPQLAWIGLSLYDRYHKLLEAAHESCDAAAAALDVHRPDLAVEWLEQGRSIVWSQLSQLRTPVDHLRSINPELATQFERISRELEHAGSQNSETTVNILTTHSNTKDRGLEKVAQQYHALALSRQTLLTEIRAIPGFERFLLPKTVKQLSSLAHSGPVVFLNASQYRCDALVIMDGSENVVHVPFSNTNHGEVAGMQLQLNDLLRLKGRTVSRDDIERGARVRGTNPDDVFRFILSFLWEKVVSPVLDVLPLPKSGTKLPRIFWCPTGPFSFLPIHAAGMYATANPGPKLSDFAISSYIPMMSALELPTTEDSSTMSCNIRLLAVPQPSTDGQVHLAGVRGEMEIIRNLVSSSPFIEFQEADGTVEGVLSKMGETDWVHFACHGTQDRGNPYDSGFLLAHGERLKLPDITRLSRPRGGLAFLSACYTATGDKQLSEEAIHTAAGMLLAGYSGVIATMWSIMDNDAPKITEDVYKSLFRDGHVPDSRQAAVALHHAIDRLRDSGVSFLSWVPFIHVGL